MMVPVVSPEDTKLDERDVFTQDDLQNLRDSITHPRERPLFEMLVFTGQRITAPRTLRRRHVKPDEDNGIFYLNDDADGLKDAEKNGKKRPLLGAKKHVRKWLRKRPKDDPDAPLWAKNGPGSLDESIGHLAIWRHLARSSRPRERQSEPGRRICLTAWPYDGRLPLPARIPTVSPSGRDAGLSRLRCP